ncbi:MAG: hypothetical protein IJ568_02025 [Bacilli bacterium]|nr:hypothetical protein [Bacilli bacterium]
MRYAYVTVLSTDNYYEGVIALFESLKKTNPKYNNFVVVVNETINKKIITKFELYGYTIIRRNKIEASFVRNDSYEYWVNTFDKLNVFSLVEFDKIVYLDSDMYIAKNIDELFSKPHMSCVIAGKRYVNSWKKLGSGLMVIEPEFGLVEKLLYVLYHEKFDKDIGDQDVIEKYYDWANNNDGLILSENYNLFIDLVDYYIDNLGFSRNSIAVVHFIGNIKPWMLNENEIEKYRYNLIKNDKKNQLYYFDKYLELIKDIV